MDPVDHLCPLDPIPSNGVLNALTLFEALRTLTQAKKACSGNNETPDTQELQPAMVTKDGCPSAFHTVLEGYTNGMLDFLGHTWCISAVLASLLIEFSFSLKIIPF